MQKSGRCMNSSFCETARAAQSARWTTEYLGFSWLASGESTVSYSLPEARGSRIKMTSEEKECPLCMEPMEADDLAFYPCDCRYQVCRFCWAKIINEENGLCPACRKGQPSFSAYITFCRSEDAMRSIRELDQGMLLGRPLRVSLGTTKYCSQFLRGTKCTKHECMYLHELGDPAASFTKEEMQAGKHTEYMNKLLAEYSSVPTIAPASTNGSLSIDSTASFSSTTEGGSNLASKDSSSTQMTRGRGRFENTQDTHVRPPVSPSSKSAARNKLPSSRQNNCPDPGSANAPIGEGRKTRQFRSEYNYPEHTPSKNSDAALQCDGSHSKNNVWSRHAPSQEYLPNGTPRSTAGKSMSTSFCPVYTNGLDNTEFNKPPSQPQSNKPSESHRTHHSSRVERGRAPCNRNPTVSEVTQNGTSNCPISPTSGSWYGHAPSNGSANQSNFGDESVDIDFDPFRESQQGLAELLAAEVGRLNVGDQPSHRRPYNVNGRMNSQEHGTSSARPLADPNILDQNIPDYHSNQSRHEHFPWVPNFMSSDRENQSDFVQNSGHSTVFPSRLFPPPGFEDSARAAQPPTDPHMFPESQGNGILDFGLSVSPCSPGTSLSVGYNNNNPGVNGSISDAGTQFPYGRSPLSFTGKPDPCDLSFDNSLHSKSAKNLDPTTHCCSGSPYYPYSDCADGGPSFKQDQMSARQDSQQAFANLFAAAFNTASAMLNNRNSAPGEKSSPVVSKSSPSTFDLGAFFSHLCRQSPFFSSLNGANTADWNNTTSMSRSVSNIQDNLIDSAAFTAAASALFPSVQFPSKSTGFLSAEDSAAGQGRQPLQNCNFPPGLSKQGAFLLSQGLSDNPAETGMFGVSSTGGVNQSPDLPSTAPPLTWQLDDPAIVSSQLSPSASVSLNQNSWKPLSGTPSTDLLQQLWRSGPNVQPMFDSHLVTPFSFNNSQKSNSSISNGNQGQQIRESSLHSTPHAQSTE
ncbi:unnamed protein product [Calicophoron daubneyi]|uniref:CCR4-NOT transcription complex subunit 4 n=1 Tax=Calicophoron daubneyi TaxID=300641 RepID=A0AAV2TMB1_CALDB